LWRGFGGADFFVYEARPAPPKEFEVGDFFVYAPFSSLPPNRQSNVKNNAHIRERIAKKLSLILPENLDHALLSGENVSRETFLFLTGCDFFAAVFSVISSVCDGLKSATKLSGRLRRAVKFFYLSRGNLNGFLRFGCYINSYPDQTVLMTKTARLRMPSPRDGAAVACPPF
jgi:hypothetical protein